MEFFKWYRKLIGGKWELISNHVTPSFWTNKPFRHCCGSRVIKVEIYD